MRNIWCVGVGEIQEETSQRYSGTLLSGFGCLPPPPQPLCASTRKYWWKYLIYRNPIKSVQISASCVPAMWLQAASVLDLEIIWNCLWAEFCMRELFVKSARASLLEFPYTALSPAGDTAPPSSEYWRGGTPRCVMIIVILLVKKWVQMCDNYCIIVPTHWPD